MTSEIIVSLTGLLSTIIGALIGGLFNLLSVYMQRSSQIESESSQGILLPAGVKLRPQKTSQIKINLWLIVLFIAALFGIAVGLNIQRSQPASPTPALENAANITYGLLALGVVVIVMLGFSLLNQRRLGCRAYSMIAVSSLILVLLAIASYYVLLQFLEQRIVYILFDASTDYNGLYDGIVSQLDIAANEIPDNVDIALTAFGGNLSGISGCGDIKELVEPSRKESALRNFDPARILLSQIHPQGNSGIENAIQFAIERLTGRKGIQQIVIIAPKIDMTCGMPSKDFIEKLALDAGIDSEIFIISVGNVSIEEQEKMIKLSDKYEHVGTPEELDDIMRDVFTVPPSLYQASN